MGTAPTAGIGIARVQGTGLRESGYIQAVPQQKIRGVAPVISQNATGASGEGRGHP